MSCGFVCGHTYIHCAYKGCDLTDVKTLKKEKDYKSVDGELYFCQLHNPIMSDIYNRHKNLVFWNPSRLYSHMDINIRYKLWAIPRALKLRKEFHNSLNEQNNSPTGHSYYELRLLEQYDTCKYIYTRGVNGELDFMCLQKMFNYGHVPNVYTNLR